MLFKPRKFRFPRGISAKAKGQLAESIFVVRAEALGLQVSKPLGESDTFDFHVQSRLGTFRVQVKSAWKVPRRHYLVAFTARTTDVSSGYDVLVVYIAPMDAWYIIPASVVQERWLLFYPHAPKKTGKYEKYLEGWRTLTGDVCDDTCRVGLESHAGRES